MRAVLVSGPGEVQLVERPRSQPGPDEVAVRVVRAGICVTDRRLATGGGDGPRVPGHEVAGRLQDGTPVGLHPDLGCGHCAYCRGGYENRCAERESVGLDRDGGLADWVVVPKDHVFPLLDVDLGVAPLLEPLGCCVHAVSHLPVEEGTPALVVGAGAMGILATWTLQAFGAEVAVSQRSQPRRRLAAELGADFVMGPEDVPTSVMARAPEVALVAAPNAQALDWALRSVGVGGTVHAFAGMPDGGHVDANLIHYRHLRLVGGTGSRVSDYQRAHRLVAEGLIDLSRLPMETIDLEDAPAALLSEQRATTLKVLVDVEGAGGP